MKCLYLANNVEQGGICMLNEYKFIRLPKQNIFLAFARLVVVAIALQL